MTRSVDMAQLPPSRLRAMMKEKVHEQWGGGPRGLVGGWWALKEIGWLISELGIRLDGDSGLLAHYDVDFLSPLHSGDWVQLRGEISRIGTTSRTVDFVVEQTIDGSNSVVDIGPDKELGGGYRLVDPPITAVKGQAVFVVPPARQRKPLPWVDDAKPAAPTTRASSAPRSSVVDPAQLPPERRSAEMIEKVHEEWGGGPRGLVGGWWAMKEVGWLLSELAIRLDGDFGPLAHYSVDFTAPIFAADWVRLHGEITRIGNESRSVSFVVEKTIDGSNLSFDAAPEGQFGIAEMLDPPLPVVKGEAVYVVPKARQRLPIP